MKRSLLTVLTAQCLVAVQTVGVMSTADVSAQSVPAAMQKELTEEDWNLWRSAFDDYEEGEMAVQKRDYDTALSCFRISLDKFTKIKKANPNWNKSAMNYRIALAERKIRNIENFLALKARHDQKDLETSGNDKEQLPVKNRSVQHESSSSDTDELQYRAETRRLQMRLDAAEKKVADLSADLERAQLSAAQVGRLMEEKSEAEKKYQVLLVQYQDLKAVSKMNPEEISRVKQDLEECREQLQTVQKKLSDTVAEKESLQKQNDSLAQEKQAVSTDLSQVQKTLSELRDVQTKFESAASKQNEAAKKIQLLEEENALLKQTSESDRAQIQQLNAEVEAGVQTLVSLKAAEAEKNSLQEQLAQKGKELVELQNARTQDAALADSLKKQLEEQKLSLQELAAVKEKNLSLESSMQNAERELQASAEKEKQLQAYAETLDSQNQSFQRTLETLSAELEKKEAVLKDLQSRQSQIQAAAEKESAEEAERDRALEELKMACKDLEARLGESEKNRQNLESENGRLKKELAASAAAGVAASSVSTTAAVHSENSKEIAEWKVRCENAEKNLKEKEQEIALLREKISKQVPVAEPMKNELDKKLQNIENENITLKKHNGELEQMLSQTLQDKNVADEEIQKLKKSLLNAQAEQEKAKIEAADDSKIREVQAKLSKSEKMRSELELEMQRLKDDLSSSSSAGAHAATQADQLRKDLAESQNKIRRLEAELEKYVRGYEPVIQERVKEKDEAISELMDDHEKLLKELDLTRKNLEGATLQMERYRRIVAESRNTAQHALEENRKLRNHYRAMNTDPEAQIQFETEAEQKQAEASANESFPIPEESFMALEDDPENASETAAVDLEAFKSFMEQAQSAEKNKRYDDALWYYLQASDVDPESPVPHLAIARLQCYYEDYRAAVKSYERALNLGASPDESLEKLLEPYRKDSDRKNRK